MNVLADTVFGSLLNSDSLVPLVLAVIAVGLLMSSLRKRQRRDGPVKSKNKQVSMPNEELTKARLRRDIDSLLVELQDLSRKISADIDVRFTKLEAAMRDADRRIATLTRLTKEAGAPSGAEGKPAVERREEQTDVRHAVVYELADAGFSPIEIAKDLGKTPGEVELILNLRKQDKA